MKVVSAIVFFVVLFAGASSFAYAETLEEQRVRLEAQLQQIELDIQNKKGLLKEKQVARTSLERDISILNSQIEKAKTSIKHRDVTLTQLKQDINEKNNAIGDLDDRLRKSKQSLAQLVRRTHEIEDLSLVELTLSGTVSDVFSDIDQFEVLQRSLSDSFDDILLVRNDLSTRKKTLEEKRIEEEELKQIQVLEKKKVEASKGQISKILTVTKGEENAYSKLIAAQEKTAAQIRAALFSLRDSSAINFGDAYRYAKESGAITGVRPAVILGILAEESNLGENVGKGTWTVDMHPTRDRPVFEEITRELGLDPNSMPVSKKAWYGWGGAMGPAQFIPSTWKLYKDRIASVTGQNPPNPWDARTAIFATALLMKDNGADKQTRAAERLAALRYLAGWKNATKSAYAFYGDEVMELADKFQSQIDVLER